MSEAENIDDFELEIPKVDYGYEPDLEDEVEEPVKVIKKPVKKSKPKVSKKVIEAKTDKGSFNLEGMKHRYKVRYNAELTEDSEKLAIFENDTVIYKLKKV